MVDWKADSNVIEKYLPSIRDALDKGDRALAKELVREVGGQVYFPRLDEVLREYDNPSTAPASLWGAWGPETDLVARGTSSVDTSFLENAAALMGSKGFTSARISAAELEGVKGAVYSAAMEESTCDLCAGLDGMEVLIPSEQFDAINPPQHCHCTCMLVYVDEEETNYNPEIVDDWQQTVLDRVNNDPERGNYDSIEALVGKNGHANPWWEGQADKADVDLTVTQRVIQRISDNMLTDMLIDEVGEEEEE